MPDSLHQKRKRTGGKGPQLQGNCNKGRNNLWGHSNNTTEVENIGEKFGTQGGARKRGSEEEKKVKKIGSKNYYERKNAITIGGSCQKKAPKEWESGFVAAQQKKVFRSSLWSSQQRRRGGTVRTGK